MLLATECCASSLKACLATGHGLKHHSYSLLNEGVCGVVCMHVGCDLPPHQLQYLTELEF